MADAQTVQDGAVDYEETMMAGLVPDAEYTQQEAEICLSNLQYLLGKVDVQLLKLENRAILQCMQQFQEETDNAGPLDEHSFLDILIRERVPPDKQVKYTEIFARYGKIPASPAKFRYAVTRFLKQKEEQSFQQALNEAFTIHTTGLTIGKRNMRGYDDAKSYLQQRMFEIESKSTTNHVPEGDIRAEATESISDYEERKANPQKFEGVKCGIAPVDEVTNGAMPGELHFICGYTEVGKTFCTINWAHYANTQQGKNVVCFTAEVIYKQWRQRVYLRHARNAAFGLPQGVSAKSFKHGQLTPQEEKAYAQAMKDFQDHKTYGKWALVQVPKGANLMYIQNRLNAYNTMWKQYGGVQACFIDSLNLIMPDAMTGRRNDDNRVLTNKMIKDSKQMAVNFDHGRGIPVISPWHANRKSWEKAVEAGEYNLASWAEADELEKSADLLWWLLRMPNAQDSHEILAGIAKYRDGAGHQKFPLYEDFDSSYIGAVSSGVTQAAAVASGGNPLFSAQNDNRAEGLF